MDGSRKCDTYVWYILYIYTIFENQKILLSEATWIKTETVTLKYDSQSQKDKQKLTALT